MNRFLRRVLFALLLGVLVYGAFVVYSGISAVRASLGGFHWWTFAAALGLATFNYVLRFAKWEYYLARLDVRGVPKFESFLVFLSGFVLTVTPGKVGEVFKSAVLAETHEVPMPRTAPIVIAERLTDVIAVILLIALGSVGFQGGLKWAVAGMVLVSVGLVLILWPAPMNWLVRRAENSSGRLHRLAPKLRESVDSLRIVASPGALLIPTLLSIVGWGCEGLALWLLLTGFGFTVPVSLAVFFYATATLAGAVVPVPGGLGVAEALIREQLVQLAHVPHGIATSAMLLVRLATLWWAVLVGFGALALLRRRFPDLLREHAEPLEVDHAA
ncbi:MAG: YbhN family protein [Polyangiaceae bacterium]